MHFEIMFSGSIQQEFCFSLLEKETMLYFSIVTFWLDEKTSPRKIKKSMIFPESEYVNPNPVR